MSEKIETGGVRYFDLVTLTTGTLVAAAGVLHPVGRGSWMAADLWRLAAVVILSVAFAAFRRRVYASNVLWPIVLFSVLLGAVMFWTLWPVPLMWFVVVASIGSLLLLVGLIAPFRHVGEPVSREDAFKFVTVTGMIAMTIGLGELSVRLMPGLFKEETRQILSSTPSNSGVAHAYIGHLHRPNRTMLFGGSDFQGSHNLDALGFRNRWPWPEHADVVAVGDSLTFGLGVSDDQAWPALVARSTHRDVINLGLIGASPEQYFRVYETFGAALRPKLLLVGVYAQNDFWDAGMFDQWLAAGVGDNYMVWRNFGRPLRFTPSVRHPIATAEGFFRAHVYPIVRSSHLYNLVRAIRGGVDGGLAATKTLFFKDNSRLRLEPDNFRTLTAGAHPGRDEFRLVLDALRKIHSLATAQGAHALLILQPGKEEVYLPLAGVPVSDPALPLRRALDEAGIDYLDLAPAFRQRAEAGERLFFEVDSHPNEAGYALIGQLVAAHIHENASAFGLGH